MGLNKKIQSNINGFTLIELLVVIAIIGTLSSVVLASLGNSKEKAKYASVVAQLLEMKKQAEFYQWTSSGDNFPSVRDGSQPLCSYADGTGNLFDSENKVIGGIGEMINVIKDLKIKSESSNFYCKSNYSNKTWSFMFTMFIDNNSGYKLFCVDNTNGMVFGPDDMANDDNGNYYSNTNNDDLANCNYIEDTGK